LFIRALPQFGPAGPSGPVFLLHRLFFLQAFCPRFSPALFQNAISFLYAWLSPREAKPIFSPFYPYFTTLIPPVVFFCSADLVGGFLSNPRSQALRPPPHPPRCFFFKPSRLVPPPDDKFPEASYVPNPLVVRTNLIFDLVRLFVCSNL